MAPYTEIETPLNEYYDPFYEYDVEFWDDPGQTVQQRMLIILGAVTLVVVAFGLLVVPKWVGTGGAIVETASAQSVQVEQAQSETSAAAGEVEAAAQIEQQTAASAASGSGGISPVFTPEVQHWTSQILAWSAQFDLDPDIIATIMQIESCGNPGAVSVAGAQGLFQVMPFHFSNGESMQDPDTNARRGMNFYNEQLRYTGGDIYLSFAGYNGGYAASGGAYARWPAETQRYHKWAKGIYDDAKAGLTSSPTLQEWLAAGGAPGCQIAASRLGLN